jgi:hypothetical protein
MSKKPAQAVQGSLHVPLAEMIKGAATGMVCMLLGGAAPRGPKPVDQTERQSWEFRQNVHRERLKAIGTIMKHRPVIAEAMEQHHIDSSALFELEFLTDWSDEEDARARTGTLERVYVAARRLGAVLSLGATVTSSGTHTPALLTDIQESIWKCLKGKALLSKEIRKLLPGLPSDEAVRKHVQAIRARGHDIKFVPQQGYVRPDAPPDRLS